MADLQVYSTALSGEAGEKEQKPFLTKNLLNIIDQNGSPDYQRNEVTFSTITWSANGRWVDYQNAWLSIPLVMKLERDDGHAITAEQAKDLLQLKGSNLSIIDSLSVEYNNQVVYQPVRNIFPYLHFKMVNETGLNDMEIQSYTGFQKHSADKWSYVTAEGMHNNDASSMEKEFFHSVKNADIQDGTDLKASGANYQEQVDVVADDADGLIHYYYYDAIIMLKDLCPFFAKLPPLLRGANIKLTMTLNQGSNVITTSAAHLKTQIDSVLSGSFMPVIRKAGTENGPYTETISVKVCQNGTAKHSKQQCRFYAPSYVMKNESEQSYLSQGSKKVLYDNVFFQRIRNIKQNDSFNNFITDSASRATKLLIVPVLNSEANGSLKKDPTTSVFTTDGVATCTPCNIANFNVQISGNPLYQAPITYKYENFMHEQNGSMGVNSGVGSRGLSSGLVSLKDFESNYNYMLIDLAKRHDYDENVPVSYAVTGTLTSKKNIDLLCYLITERDVTIDLTTGALL